MTILWIILLVVIVVAVFVVELLFGKKQLKREYEYRKRGCLMTQSEKICFDALITAVDSKYYIFPQIHLPNILDHEVVGQNWYGAFRHIDEKSVDFVLCDKISLSPILAIELDDRSHDRPDRQERDKEVERILKDAGLPLLRLKNGPINLLQRINDCIAPDYSAVKKEP